MTQLLQIYKAQFRIHLAVQFQYRVMMLIWMIGLIVTPVVYLVVWNTVAEANGGAVDGLTPPLFAAYFIGMLIVNQLTYTWVMWEYDYIIRQGQLSPQLLRPFHPIHKDIAENLSFKCLTFVVMLPIVGLLIWGFRPQFNFNTVQLFAFVLSVLFAFGIQFIFGWLVAILAFWTNRISAVNRIYFLGKLFLAGQMAPLTLLPPALETAASYTPYRWMLSFPVELLMGWRTGGDIWRGLLFQLVWLVIGVVASQLIWRAGIKRYSAFGA